MFDADRPADRLELEPDRIWHDSVSVSDCILSTAASLQLRRDAAHRQRVVVDFWLSLARVVCTGRHRLERVSAQASISPPKPGEPIPETKPRGCESSPRHPERCLIIEE